MPDPGVRGHDHPCSCDLGAPTQVEVLSHDDQVRVEPSELHEEIPADEGEPAWRREHVADGIVLTLVDLAAFDAVYDRAALVDLHADVQKPVGPVPFDELRAYDSGVGPVGLFNHVPERTGVRRDVVVREHQEVGALDHRDGRVGRRTEPDVRVEPAHERIRESCRHPRGRVGLASGVEHQHRDLGIVLSCNGLECGLEPGSGVVRHDDDDHRWSQGLHEDIEASQPATGDPGYCL